MIAMARQTSAGWAEPSRASVSIQGLPFLLLPAIGQKPCLLQPGPMAMVAVDLRFLRGRRGRERCGRRTVVAATQSEMQVNEIGKLSIP